jgi:hypothetical protein
MLHRAVLLLIVLSTPLVWFAATPALAAGPGAGISYNSETDLAFAQSILDAEGYLQQGDYTAGRRDRATTDAIADFQRAHSLPTDGRLDFDTMAMLLSHEPPVVQTASVAQRQAAPSPRKQARAASQPPEQPVRAASPPSTTPAAAEEPAGHGVAMPETASPVPLLALLGGILIAGGVGIMLGRPARG